MDSDNLEFLSNFLQLAEDTFVEQINTNLAYLTPGQNLFDQMIGIIRGIVEIEQAKRDRERLKKEQELQDTVEAIGIGIGTAAILASTSPLIFDKPWRWPSSPDSSWYPHPFIITVVISAGFGLFLGLAVKKLHKGSRN